MRRLIVLGLFFLLAIPMPAAADDGLAGWERANSYDKHYDVSERDKLKGEIVEIMDVTPMEGMAPGVGLVLRDKADGEKVAVHLGPKAYIDLDANGIRQGMAVKVYGAWGLFGDTDVFMASKIKKDNEAQYKFRRTSDGYPYWSMTPEMLKAQEE